MKSRLRIALLAEAMAALLLRSPPAFAQDAVTLLPGETCYR